MAQALMDSRVEELGGPGWRVREQTHVLDTVDPWPPPGQPPRSRPAWRRAATAAVALALFSASGVVAIALSPSQPAAPAVSTAVPPRATASTATLAPAPRQPNLPVPAQLMQAAHDYAGVAAPLTRA